MTATTTHVRISFLNVRARTTGLTLDHGWQPTKVKLTMRWTFRRGWYPAHIAVNGPSTIGWLFRTYPHRDMPAWLAPIVAELLHRWETR